MAKQNQIKKKLKDGKEKVYRYERSPEIRFPCSNKMKEEVNNLISNLGVDAPAFHKMKMREILNSYPPHLLLPPKQY